MTTNEEMLGRADVNDLEAILAITTKDVDEMVHAVKDNADAHLHVGLREGRAPGAQQALREGQGRPVERRDRPPLGHSTSTSRRSSPTRRATPTSDPVLVAAQQPGQPLAQLGREGVADARSSRARTGR